MLSVEDLRQPSPLPERFNLASHVLWDNGADDDKLALVVFKSSGAERWSYAKLRHVVLATGAGLLEAGLSRGDRLLLRLGNTTEFPIAFLGAIAAGILPVPTSAALTKPEISVLANILQPDAVLAGNGIAQPDATKTLHLSDLPETAPLARPITVSPHDPAYIVFTSGTSGKPLGVLHAHRAVWARRMMTDGWYGLTPNDRLLHAGAFNWTYTLGTGLLDPWSVGATALIPGSGVTTDMLPLLLKRHDATLFAAVPGIYRRLLRQKALSLPKLRHGLSAGEKLPESLREKWRAATGTEIYEAFGQSEISTFISASPTRPAPPGTLGSAQPGRAVSILGGDAPVARGEIGEIAVHKGDPGLMLGYLDSTPVHISGDWFRTGDLGLMRPDGAIEHAGRIDDVLTAGGFRFSPLEIEEAMSTMPGLTDAAAVDYQLDAETAVVALHYAAKEVLDQTALEAHAQTRLAAQKRPRIFVHHRSLPRGANGKLLRRQLRAANQIES